MVKGLRLLKIKDQHNISERAFNKILEVMEIPHITLYKLQKFLRNQVPIEPNIVDCCINFCIAFTGENADKDQYSIYEEKQYKGEQKSLEDQKKAAYWSVISSLKIQYQDKNHAELL